ncbi:MAG: ferrous iron transport protein A [Gammaproteobacteria bacterium]|nr:ferrous iron transport protein A [Gammaproteobacteria bacterium]
MATTLADLAPGQRGSITGYAQDDAFTQRLMQLGLIEGADVEMLRCAPTGDPIEVRVMGYALSLRRNEAALVHVDLLA